MGLAMGFAVGAGVGAGVEGAVGAVCLRAVFLAGGDLCVAMALPSLIGDGFKTFAPMGGVVMILFAGWAVDSVDARIYGEYPAATWDDGVAANWLAGCG
jgi:hypothetical protein